MSNRDKDLEDVQTIDTLVQGREPEALTTARRKYAEVLERRTKVAELMLKGYTYKQIAEALGMSRGCGEATVSRDVAHIKDSWKRSQIRDFDAVKEKQFRKLELLEKELWTAWEDSKEDIIIERATTNQTKPKPRTVLETLGMDEDDEQAQAAIEAAPLVTESRSETITREKRDPNPAFSAQLMSVIDRQNELMGITAKTAGESTSPAVVSFKIFSTPSREKELTEKGLLGSPAEHQNDNDTDFGRHDTPHEEPHDRLVINASESSREETKTEQEKVEV